MQLMNNELADALQKYPLYSQDGKKGDAVVVAKYFFPATALAWYVTEGRREDNDYLFFGLVVGTDTSAEMGYFSLSPNYSIFMVRFNTSPTPPGDSAFFASPGTISQV